METALSSAALKSEVDKSQHATQSLDSQLGPATPKLGNKGAVAVLDVVAEFQRGGHKLRELESHGCHVPEKVSRAQQVTHLTRWETSPMEAKYAAVLRPIGLICAI